MLVDTGCSRTVVGSWVTKCPGAWKGSVRGVDGREVPCEGHTVVQIEVDGLTASVDCVVMNRLIEGVDVVLGMDFIQCFGGIELSNGRVKFLSGHGHVRASNVERKSRAAVSQAKSVPIVEDRDFQAVFDGKSWVVKWRWKEGGPPVLNNRIDCYSSARAEPVKAKFEEEVKAWIERRWMRLCEDQNNTKGILPLMAVMQANKDKVRPVLDYRELNQYVESHPGVDVAVCTETLRKWRQLPKHL